jgi:hypothetical protein
MIIKNANLLQFSPFFIPTKFNGHILVFTIDKREKKYSGGNI